MRIAQILLQGIIFYCRLVWSFSREKRHLSTNLLSDATEKSSNNSFADHLHGTSTNNVTINRSTLTANIPPTAQTSGGGSAFCVLGGIHCVSAIASALAATFSFF
jgi:hypothetical protein